MVIAKNFNETPEDVQIQALEVSLSRWIDTGQSLIIRQLLRSRRIFTKTAVHSTPKIFLFVPVTTQTAAGSSSHLNKHLVRRHTGFNVGIC
jgi:hypothetical protein